MKHMRAYRILLVLCLLGSGAAAAQEATRLAKQTQNPVADLTSIPFQFNFYTGGDLKNRTLSTLNLQPVLPLKFTERLNVIARPVVPVVNTPLPNDERDLGLGDIRTQLFVTPDDPGRVVYGLGPVFYFPTATNDSVRTGQWGLGPAGVLVLPVGPWVLGLLVDPVWRIGGSKRGPDIDSLSMQLLVNFNFKHGWALSAQPLITANWSAPRGNEWTLPLGFGVAKVHTIGSQKLNLSLQYYRNVVYPEGAGANQMRILIAFLFPHAAKTPGPAQEAAQRLTSLPELARLDPR